MTSSNFATNTLKRRLAWIPLQVAIIGLVIIEFREFTRLNRDAKESAKPELNQHPELPSKLMTDIPEKSFGACLILMDDNHYLIEWLAYHYQVLPLRRLIVAIDPRSETMPTEIMDRYRNRGLMKITEWQEEDFMPPHLLGMHAHVSENDEWGLKNLYIERQLQFYNRCMAYLKHENITWTAMIDTDEYILPNVHADEEIRLKNIRNRSIFEMLEDLMHPMTSTGCISMHRLMFGFKESNFNQVQNMVPPGFNGSDFITLRFRYHTELTNKNFNKVGKCMIDLSRVDESKFVPAEINAHRPIKSRCTESFLTMLKSILVIC